MSAFYDRKYDVLGCRLRSLRASRHSERQHVDHPPRRPFGLAQLYHCAGPSGAPRRVPMLTLRPRHGAITDTAESGSSCWAISTRCVRLQCEPRPRHSRRGQSVGDEQWDYPRSRLRTYSPMLEEAIWGQGRRQQESCRRARPVTDDHRRRAILDPRGLCPRPAAAHGALSPPSTMPRIARRRRFAAEMIDASVRCRPNREPCPAHGSRRTARLGHRQADGRHQGRARVVPRQNQFANVPGPDRLCSSGEGRARLRPTTQVSVSGDWVSTGARLTGRCNCRRASGNWRGRQARFCLRRKESATLRPTVSYPA